MCRQLDWIGNNYTLQDPTTERSEPCMPMIMAYLFQQTYIIQQYKRNAEAEGISGSETAENCSGNALALQLLMAVKIFPEAGDKMEKFSIPVEQSTSLAWKGVMYKVLCDDGKPLHKGAF